MINFKKQSNIKINYPTDFRIIIDEILDRDLIPINKEDAHFNLEFFSAAAKNFLLSGGDIPNDLKYICSYDGTNRVNNIIKDGKIVLLFSGYPIQEGYIYYRQLDQYPSTDFSDSIENIYNCAFLPGITIGRFCASSEPNRDIYATISIAALKGDKGEKGEKGEAIELKSTSDGISWKYLNDIQWTSLVEYDTLKLKFSDLTIADIKLLQQPANDSIKRIQAVETTIVEADGLRSAAEVTREEAFITLKSESQAATLSAIETATHPTYVGEDNYIYIWDIGIKAYNKTNIYVKGDPFSIKKTYPSIAIMEANFGSSDTVVGDFVLIETENTEDPDNSKLYVKTATKWGFLTDMSGAIGFTGKTAQFSIGLVTTVEHNLPASVTLSEDGVDTSGNPKYRINLALPRGKGLDYNTMTPEEKAAIKGMSAYQVAVENGYVGTEIEWLSSLKGDGGMFDPTTEFPALTTTNKTVIGAINELNPKIFKFDIMSLIGLGFNTTKTESELIEIGLFSSKAEITRYVTDFFNDDNAKIEIFIDAPASMNGYDYQSNSSITTKSKVQLSNEGVVVDGFYEYVIFYTIQLITDSYKGIFETHNCKLIILHNTIDNVFSGMQIIDSDKDLSDYQQKSDDALATADKTVIGAINELKAKVDEGGQGGVSEEDVFRIIEYQKGQDLPSYKMVWNPIGFNEVGSPMWKSIKYNYSSSSVTMSLVTFNYTSIPDADISGNTNITLNGCTTLKTAPRLFLGDRTSLNAMFFGCVALQAIPLLDTSKVTNMNSMFYGCAVLQAIPLLDTSKVTTMHVMFYGCIALQAIPLLDTSKVTVTENMFANCVKLETCYLKMLNASVSFAQSPLLTRESMLYIFENAQQQATKTKTISLGEVNLAKLSAADKLIATNKNFILS